MMATRVDLRDELEVLLGAARSLSADTDRYLAETFLARLERQRPISTRRAMPALRLRRRFAAALLALAVLAVGGPLALHEYVGLSAVTCVPTIVKHYPSMAAAKADWASMRADNYLLTGSRQYGHGHVTFDYSRMGGCAE